ncbi:hypothetical protein GWK47_022773 [Chionoecetes opilio]|uniref:Uncharacterized protein n=1 Tax=Chionoecetes opilio TaxID=41210 RepID=A0A8J5CF80_CHIOP|nr:hypothetical protein GWK47_022773 [Chionoecetes opilio]
MTSAEAGQGRRGVVMVGPSYLYHGAQVCGRRTSRTCIFLLGTFGTALNLIGVVFLTADLSMESGLWAAGLTCILLGMVLLVWFITLCCAARCTFKALPPSHPARTTSSAPVLAPPRSSTYQLLPLSPNRTHVTPGSQVSATQTLPISATHKASRMSDPIGYPTWGHGGRGKEYEAGQAGVQPAVYTWAASQGQTGHYQGPRGYSSQHHLIGYRNATVPTRHLLRSTTPALQEELYSPGFRMGRQLPTRRRQVWVTTSRHPITVSSLARNLDLRIKENNVTIFSSLWVETEARQRHGDTNNTEAGTQ